MWLKQRSQPGRFQLAYNRQTEVAIFIQVTRLIYAERASSFRWFVYSERDESGGKGGAAARVSWGICDQIWPLIPLRYARDCPLMEFPIMSSRHRLRFTTKEGSTLPRGSLRTSWSRNRHSLLAFNVDCHAPRGLPTLRPRGQRTPLVDVDAVNGRFWFQWLCQLAYLAVTLIARKRGNRLALRMLSKSFSPLSSCVYI